jgi:hypothetical protein
MFPTDTSAAREGYSICKNAMQQFENARREIELTIHSLTEMLCHQQKRRKTGLSFISSWERSLASFCYCLPFGTVAGRSIAPFAFRERWRGSSRAPKFDLRARVYETVPQLSCLYECCNLQCLFQSQFQSDHIGLGPPPFQPALSPGSDCLGQASGNLHRKWSLAPQKYQSGLLPCLDL